VGVHVGDVQVGGALHAESPALRLRENSTFGCCYFSGGLPQGFTELYEEPYYLKQTTT
jgi:hypothetical protein